MASKLQEFWNEFDWEKELRKDDERIHTYFRELPSYIDLPNEDELIYKRIKRREDLVPHGGVWPLQFWEMENPSEEDLDPMAQMRDKALQTSASGSTALVISYKQAKILAMFPVIDPELAKHQEVMRLQCLVGKLIVALINILNLSSAGELPALRIAMCKRCMATLNEIYGELKKLEPLSNCEESEFYIQHMFSRFGLIRDDVLETLKKLRNPSAKSSNPFDMGTDEDIDDDDIPF